MFSENFWIILKHKTFLEKNFINKEAYFEERVQNLRIVNNIRYIIRLSYI